MQIVIDIPETAREKAIWEDSQDYDIEDIEILRKAVVNGTPLPKGHGRLIDADDLRIDFKSSKQITFAERMKIACIVDIAPTIIEADKGE